MNRTNSNNNRDSNGMNKFNGVLTGYSMLDSLTGGLRNSDLVLLASYEKMGRLPFLISLAYKSSIEHNSNVGFISLDSSADLIRKYLTQSALETPFNEIDFSNLDTKQTSILKQIGDHNITICDKAYIQLHKLLDQCNTMKYDNNVDFIIVSDLESIQLSQAHNTDCRNEIVRSIKIHARALDIPIILASSLPLEENTEEFYPTLKKLNSYGNFGDYADQILFLYRPEHYGIDFDAEGNSYRDGNIIILAKSRYGRKGEVMMRYSQCCTRFDEF